MCWAQMRDRAFECGDGVSRRGSRTDGDKTRVSDEEGQEGCARQQSIRSTWPGGRSRV